MENYSSIKTCGTCMAFGKSSCAYPTSEVNSISCTKYQEVYYTSSATSQTTEISKPIMKEENKLKHTTVSVYKVNETCIVAQTIEDAIKLYKDAYEWPYNMVKSVKLVNDSAWIEEDENTSANMQDCVSSKDYVVQCDYTAKADEKD